MPHFGYYIAKTPKEKAKEKPKNYGKCGFFRNHKIIKNKNGQYTCKYCGKTKLTLDEALKTKEKQKPKTKGNWRF